MKYRIKEKNGVFTPQIKCMWMWLDFSVSYSKKESALDKIKQYHKRQKNIDNRHTFHYVNENDLIE